MRCNLGLLIDSKGGKRKNPIVFKNVDIDMDLAGIARAFKGGGIYSVTCKFQAQKIAISKGAIQLHGLEEYKKDKWRYQIWNLWGWENEAIDNGR